MTVKVFLSTDDSAPVLTGQAGSLISLLDACLVNGYGTKVSLGWSKPFSSTNLSVYRQLSGGQRYLRVDNGSYNSGTYYAKVRGYEEMTDATTGTGPFPTDLQSNGGMMWRTSSTNDSTARAWAVIGDEKFFYIVIEHGWGANYRQFGFFGDFISYKSGDAYNQAIGGEHITSGNMMPIYNSISAPGTIDSVTSSVYVARQYTQLGGSATANLPFDGFQFTGVQPGTQPSGTFPSLLNPASGDLFFGKHYFCDKNSLRGEMPGLWAPLFLGSGNFSHGDVIAGTGNLTGKTLKLFQVGNNYGQNWTVVETSNTWY